MSRAPVALAFDLGASSGRAVRAGLDDGRIRFDEVHRFVNEPVPMNGTQYWDFLHILAGIRTGLLKARDAGGFDSVGVDSWGVDFGLLDADGYLLENPVHYRDRRTEGMVEALLQRVGRQQVYGETGIQILPINTLIQLFSVAQRRPALRDRTARVLFTPDLINYCLSGRMATERTIASTSAMLRPDGTWSDPLTSGLGLDRAWFAPLVEPGTVLGPLSSGLRDELGLPGAEVVAVASHDTASAVLAVPVRPGERCAFLSSGTWSVLGVERDRPVISGRSCDLNFSNEGGYGGTTRLLKNIMGLWLIQETRRQWAREGRQLSFDDMEHAALDSAPFRSLVDPDWPEFGRMGDLPGRVRTYCRDTGQPVPETDGQMTRCLYESLALKYRVVLDEVKELTGEEFSCLRVVGGGVRDRLLTQFTADATGLPVEAGPVEATALGNVCVQWLAAGALSGVDEARDVIRRSSEIVRFEPGHGSAWAEALRRFRDICES